MVRVATWNLWWKPNARDARTEAAALVLGAAKVDVVCLQEVYLGGAEGSNVAAALAQRLGLHVASAAVVHTTPAGDQLGVAVLARHPTGATQTLTWVPDPATGIGRASPGEHGDELGDLGALAPAWAWGMTCAQLTGDAWGALAGSWVGSTHLSWGLAAEHVRLSEARQLDCMAGELLGEPAGALNPGFGPATFVLGGDFNTTRAHDTLRWLCGEHVIDNSSTYWVDAHDAAGVGDGCTSVPTDPWAAIEATGHGLDPAHLPARRIDHLLVRGWRWGRPGSVVACTTVGGDPVMTSAGLLTASDHRGVVADLAT